MKLLNPTHNFLYVCALAFYDAADTYDKQISQSKVVQRQELKLGPLMVSPGVLHCTILSFLCIILCMISFACSS